MAHAGWPSGGSRPTRRLESTVAALAVARAHSDPGATLDVIGKPATESYVAALHRYVAELGLDGAVRFAGHASDATVASAYAAADVLVVTSEHEGFCVPVVEAMAAGVPVVAFDQGAVPEVLGGAGVLVSDKDPYALASSIDALLADAPRREAMVAAGRRRLAELDLAAAADRFVGLLVPLTERAASVVVTAVHQFVPMLHRADAVGTAHAARCATCWPGVGSDRTSTSRWTDPETESETRPFARYAEEAEAGDVLLYQFATASAIAPWLGARPETLVVNYHNVTPPEQLRRLGQRPGAPPAPGPERSCGSWRPVPRSAWPCRPSTRRSCAAAGFAPHRGRPARRDRADSMRAARAGTSRPTGTGAGWVSVGRLAPNKADRAGRHGAPRHPRPPRSGGHARGRGPAGGPVLHGGAAPLHRRDGAARAP